MPTSPSPAAPSLAATCSAAPSALPKLASFSARPLRTNIGEIQSLILEADAAPDRRHASLEPEKIKQLVLFYTDLLHRLLRARR